ncbi:MAG: histidine phosphatase family protein [Candidatus Paceibacterota bacterium]|jgi:broad specificity phosphatase PhoE
MGTKVIYFVRHGQTEANLAGVRQGEGGSLSAKGREQALATAKRFPKQKGRPDIIYASPFLRTKETAEIIAKELNLKIKYTDLLKERKNPTEIIGHWGGEPEIKRMIDRMDVSYHDDDLRVSDEENFSDLKKRAKKLLYFISTRYHKKIIMVTHKIFLKMVIAYMLHGEKLTASEYNSLSYFNPIDNAGMAICTYKHHWLRPNEWKLVVWNDLD